MKTSEDLICQLLDEWALRNSTNRNRWNSNKIGKKIKFIVESFDNWKGAGRWIPHKDHLKYCGETRITSKGTKIRYLKSITQNNIEYVSVFNLNDNTEHLVKLEDYLKWEKLVEKPKKPLDHPADNP